MVDKAVFVHEGATRYSFNLDKAHHVGAGGEGDVYRVPSGGRFTGSVAKIYKKISVDKSSNTESDRIKGKLNAMLASAPENVHAFVDSMKIVQIAWPTHIVEDVDGRCIGFLMPEINFKTTESLVPYTESSHTATEKLVGDQNSLPMRIIILRNIAALLADLHRRGHAFIDIKPPNMRVTPSTCMVAFIDCDSYLINSSSGLFPASVASDEYASPEWLQHGDPSQLGEPHDRWAFARLAFRVLNFGIDPFNAKPKPGLVLDEFIAYGGDVNYFVRKRLYAYGSRSVNEVSPQPQSTHECWPKATLDLFESAFTSKDQTRRPALSEWRQHFRDLIEQRDFVKCQSKPADPNHIHFVGKPCRKCFLEKRAASMNVRQPPASRLSTQKCYQSSIPLNAYANSPSLTGSLALPSQPSPVVHPPLVPINNPYASPLPTSPMPISPYQPAQSATPKKSRWEEVGQLLLAGIAYVLSATFNFVWELLETGFRKDPKATIFALMFFGGIAYVFVTHTPSTATLAAVQTSVSAIPNRPEERNRTNRQTLATTGADSPEDNLVGTRQDRRNKQQRLDSYDALWTTLNKIIIPRGGFASRADLLSESEMRLLEVRLRRVHGADVQVRGLTYGLRGTNNQCKAFAEQIGQGLVDANYEIVGGAAGWKIVPCYLNGDLIGVWTMAAQSERLPI